jgi:hypothetical protein
VTDERADTGKIVPDKQIENIDKYVLFCSKCMGDK